MERGYLHDTFVDEWQQVAKGKAMFRIMPNLYKADRQKAKAVAKMTKIKYDNTKTLADKNIVSPDEVPLPRPTPRSVYRKHISASPISTRLSTASLIT